MKQIALIATVLFLALGCVQAQSSMIDQNGPEVHIRNLIQNMTTAYKLTGDQQIAVKAAAGTIAENVRVSGSTNKEVYRNEFHNAVKKIISSDQYNHYLNVQKQSVNTILDAMIDSAKNSKAGGK